MKEKFWITCLDFLNKYYKAFTVVFAVVAGIWYFFGYFWQKPVATGPSVNEQINISGNQNSVNVIKSVSEAKLNEKQFKLLMNSLDAGLNELKFEIEFEGKSEIINGLFNQLESQNLTIDLLQEKVKSQGERINQILVSTDISDEIKELIKNGRINEAEELSDNYIDNVLIEEEKNIAKNYFLNGLIKAIRLNYSTALESLLKATTIQPNNYTYLYETSKIYYDLGKYSEAVDFAQRALNEAKKI